MLAASEAHGGFPKRVHEEVRRFLGCGDVRRGFTLAKCEACKESTLIAFSCKSRGWCPSCGARRAHEAEAHLLEVLPKVGFRHYPEISFMWSKPGGFEGGDRFLLDIKAGRSSGGPAR